MISWLKRCYSDRSRAKRAHLFREHLRPTESDRILDLGGRDGSYIALVIPFRKNVWVADIHSGRLEHAADHFGFQTKLLDESGRLPFEDGYFDITFCNSVIQHVTVDKDEITEIETTREFRERSSHRQKLFADEIRRVSKSYFVQTPNKYFIIESCTWLPVFIYLLPRRMFIWILRRLAYFWPKTTQADYNLLTAREFQTLFPDASIVKEKSLFMTKSFSAIKGRS
jgi:SAM-dependent methyltransferase